MNWMIGDRVTPTHGPGAGEPATVLEITKTGVRVELEMHGHAIEVECAPDGLTRVQAPVDAARVRLRERIRTRERDELFAWWIEQARRLEDEPSEQTLVRLDSECMAWCSRQRVLREERRARLVRRLEATFSEAESAQHAQAHFDAECREELARIEHDDASRRRAGLLMDRAAALRPGSTQ